MNEDAMKLVGRTVVDVDREDGWLALVLDNGEILRIVAGIDGELSLTYTEAA